MIEKDGTDPLEAAVARVVQAFLAHNSLSEDAAAKFIADVRRKLANKAALAQKSQRGSVDSGDFVICLECGKQLKSMRRHLRERHHLTPSDYTKKWQLPNEHAMVAPNFSQKRSETARRSRLGHLKPR